MQKALRFFAQNASRFTAISFVTMVLMMVFVPYGTALFTWIMIPVMLVGLAGSAILFLEDHARIQGW
jgi:hypothetical protein